MAEYSIIKWCTFKFKKWADKIVAKTTLLEAQVDKVSSVEGVASVFNRHNKINYSYNFKITLEWSGVLEKELVGGTITISDMRSEDEDEFDVTVTIYDKETPEYVQEAIDNGIRKLVSGFVSEMHTTAYMNSLSNDQVRSLSHTEETEQIQTNTPTSFMSNFEIMRSLGVINQAQYTVARNTQTQAIVTIKAVSLVSDDDQYDDVQVIDLAGDDTSSSSSDSDNEQESQEITYNENIQEIQALSVSEEYQIPDQMDVVNDEKQAVRLINKMQEIPCEYVIKVVQQEEGEEKLYTVFEGELVSLKKMISGLQESKAIEYIKQLVQGVKHVQQVVDTPLNLTPNSIYIDQQTGILKLGEQIFANLKSSVIDNRYCAPEGYDVAFSVGCIIHFLVTGKHAFKHEKRDYQPPSTLSNSTQNLLKSLLTFDAKTRMTLNQILEVE
jgi:serine/threonine protein kinase